MRRHYILLFLIITAFFSCTPRPDGDVVQMKGAPNIYPDYTDVTIPVNIAPLNFLLRDSVEAIELTASCGDKEIQINRRGNEVCFDEDEWHELLSSAAGKDINVTLSAVGGDRQWKQWGFKWHVTNDSIDPYLTYRLIEPDYEIWSNIQIQQRCLENFEERNISDYMHVGDKCMNCHTYGSQNPNLSMLYVRGEGGGAILNRNGKLRKLNLKTEDMVSGSVYFGFSPSGRYIAFSTNVIIPAFHSRPDKRLEVFDSKSDVYVADLERNTMIRSELLCDSMVFETFPTFSPDGKYIYYCAAKRVRLPQDLGKLRYSLVRIPFDEQTGTIGTEVDTVFHASQATTDAKGNSVCHPRISPDGKHLLFTVQDYGTFPIWHRESDLWMMDLRTGQTDMLTIVNSDKSDTYHSWSSNSRWFVFASKRDDGLYGKPYFCYVDRKGKAHKPFVLPQKDPTKYDNILKSFNAPELGRGSVPFTAEEVAKMMKTEAESFH